MPKDKYGVSKYDKSDMPKMKPKMVKMPMTMRKNKPAMKQPRRVMRKRARGRGGMGGS